MSQVFDTPESILRYKAIVIKHALSFYAKTGMKVNSAYTPTNMLKAAKDITGTTFKRGQYKEAAEAIEAWLQANKPTD